MTPDEYLQAVLTGQAFAPDSPELADLQTHGSEVKAVLSKKFGTAARLREAGSKKKGTMIRESYDLDLACYFPHDDNSAGETIPEIYENVEGTLQEEYLVVRKGCAVRVWDRSGQVDFHVDVVPGRFVEDDDGDVFLYLSSGDKNRLRTNLDVHIAHVRDSGVREAIKLGKLWRTRNLIPMKTFPLELLVIDLLKDMTSSALSEQLMHVWIQFRDEADNLSAEDPANPSGNDLSELVDAVRLQLSSVAAATLRTVENNGWEAVFGEVQEKAQRAESLRHIATSSPARQKPWACG